MSCMNIINNKCDFDVCQYVHAMCFVCYRITKSAMNNRAQSKKCNSIFVAITPCQQYPMFALSNLETMNTHCNHTMSIMDGVTQFYVMYSDNSIIGNVISIIISHQSSINIISTTIRHISHQRTSYQLLQFPPPPLLLWTPAQQQVMVA